MPILIKKKGIKSMISASVDAKKEDQMKLNISRKQEIRKKTNYIKIGQNNSKNKQSQSCFLKKVNKIYSLPEKTNKKKEERKHILTISRIKERTQNLW